MPALTDLAPQLGQFAFKGLNSGLKAGDDF